jgi:hydroxylaminobenzene mutase
VESSGLLARQGHRLLQLGTGLLLFTSFEGFMIPYFTAPNLGRSVHTLSALSGVLLLALGLLWPRLKLRAASSRVTFCSLVYSDLAILAAFLLASIWGAGNTVMPLAAGGARGTDLQETAIALVAYSAAPTGILFIRADFLGTSHPAGQHARKIERAMT